VPRKHQKSQVQSFEYPVIVPVWAEEIRVRLSGENLIVRGVPGPFSGPSPRSDSLEDLSSFSDLPFLQEEMRRSIYLDLLRPVFEQLQIKGTELPAHLQFANAKGSEQLIEFTTRFGPVHATVFSQGFSGRIRAVQNLHLLSVEQHVFSALVGLLAAVKQLEPAAQDTRAKRFAYNRLPSIPVLVKERHLKSYESTRESASAAATAVLDALIRFQEMTTIACGSQLRGFWDDAELQGKLTAELPVVARQCDPEIMSMVGHEVLQRVLDNFPPALISADGFVVECPRMSRSGIRSALYFMLRLDYLQGRCLAFCANDACGRVFTVLRMNARCCSPRCSSRRSDKKYYASKGKGQRRARRARQKQS
jgi:hypothetical protein